MSAMRDDNGGQTGGVLEVVLASVALAIAVVALVVAFTHRSGNAKSAAATAVTTTTMSPQQVCQAKLDKFKQEWRFREAQAAQLRTLEQQLNAQLTAELAVTSPNAGATDASHQAVLREQSDIQQRLLHLGEQRPDCSITAP
jgi:hypothetical protein